MDSDTMAKYNEKPHWKPDSGVLSREFFKWLRNLSESDSAKVTYFEPSRSIFWTAQIQSGSLRIRRSRLRQLRQCCRVAIPRRNGLRGESANNWWRRSFTCWITSSDYSTRWVNFGLIIEELSRSSTTWWRQPWMYSWRSQEKTILLKRSKWRAKIRRLSNCPYKRLNSSMSSSKSEKNSCSL